MKKLKKFELTVSTACTENWDAMHQSDAANEKFCDKCCKQVVDFTGYTDEELARYFANYKGGTCGRMSSNQMNKTLLFTEPRPAHSLYRYAPWLLGVGAAFSMAACANPTGHLKDMFPGTHLVSDNGKKTMGEMVVLHPPAMDTISGYVYGEHMKPVVAAKIILNDSINIATTDAHGKFKFAVQPDQLSADSTIQLKTADPNNRWFKVQKEIKHPFTSPIKLVLLDESRKLMGEVIKVEPHP